MSYWRIWVVVGRGNFNRKVMMTKLTLNLESLDVQSFEPVEAQQASGTVFGAEPSYTTPDCCYTFGCGDSVRQAC